MLPSPPRKGEPETTIVPYPNFTGSGPRNSGQISSRPHTSFGPPNGGESPAISGKPRT